MERSKNVKAIIFDFDGVLVISEFLHYKAFAKALQEMGGQMDWSDYAANFIGVPDKVTAQESLKRSGLDHSPAAVDTLLRRKTQIFDEELPHGIIVAEGLTEVIRELHKTYYLAIASGAFRHQIIPILQYHQIQNAFVTVVGQDDVTKGKPDPEPYLLAWRRIREATNTDIQQGQCLVVEDALPGIEAARRAGMPSVAIATYFPPSAFPDGQIVLSQLKDLLKEETWRLIDKTFFGK
ncbi:MAG: HAD family phosphatase [Armatimonadetes bacterium]|nr:HAD family phosphatase [Armatimonadota bacterium]MDW8121219.1 HAD family phosphatase [Armatimonadota bacterium]